MSVTRKLLTRIKALFEPSRPAEPPQQFEEVPAPAATVTELAEAHLPEPITFPVEPPPAEEARALVGEAPALVADAPAVAAEAPAFVDEAPTFIEEAATEVPPMVPAAPAGGLTLRLETERGTRSTFAVTKSGATIGRGPESVIQLADLSVSRKHARITYKQGAYWLSDLGSMGGTWVNGTKLAAPRRVATGQTIDIGVCRLTVVSAGADEESSAAEGPSHAASGSTR